MGVKDVVLGGHPPVAEDARTGAELEHKLREALKADSDVPMPYMVALAGSGPSSERDLANRFTYHPPKPGQQERYQDLRSRAFGLAVAIRVMTPAGREQELALTHLEEAIFWANAAIARGE
jgi:hypothetical protein